MTDKPLVDGVLVIDKPAGCTSHDVVARVKRRLKAAKVGHLGTLDPAATGVLPLVINRATKYARFFEGGRKGYTAVMKLGEETDTYDGEGKVTATAATSGLKEGDVVKALKAFEGRIKQLPPMYSAVKLGGTPLYKLARKGLVVERKEKEVEVYSVEVLSVELPYVEFSVECSRGTYLRTICFDAGRALGCGAHLASLKRTSSAIFTSGDAVELDSTDERLRESVIALEALINRLKPVELASGEADGLSKGRGPVTPDGAGDEAFFSSLSDGEMVRFMHDDTLLALALHIGAGAFKVEKVFV